MANNPYVNKVVFGSATLVDLTGTTATADKILQGYGAYGADGAWMDGTATGGGGRYQAKTVTPSTVQQIIRPDKIVYGIDVPVGTVNTATSGLDVSWQYESYSLVSGETYEVEGEFTFDDGTVVTLSGPGTASYYIQPTVSSTGPSTVSDVLLLNSVLYIEFTSTAPSGGVVSKAFRVYIANQQEYDALSQVTVEAIPPSGSSNAVSGNFTTNSSYGTQEISIPYNGTGYPIAACVYVYDGPYNSSSTIYSLVKRYGIVMENIVKAEQDTAPTYTSSGSNNYGSVAVRYKSSSSSGTSQSTTGNASSNIFSSNNPSGSSTESIRFSASNKMKVYVMNSSYGLLPSTKYAYHVIYSS